MRQTVFTACDKTEVFDEISKPLRRLDYVLQMAIDANIAMTLEYIANMCFIILAGMGIVGVPQFWIMVASVVLAPIALVLIGYSGQRMRRVNEATGLYEQSRPNATSAAVK